MDSSLQDPAELFSYHFNNNDPVNRKKSYSTENYMNKLSDWMELFNIKPPEKYFHGGGGVFGRSSMEHDIQFDFGRSQRRPQLWNRIKIEPQLFGPNIVFSVGKSNISDIQSTLRLYPIVAHVLQGAGAVEQIITSLLNGSHFMSVKNETGDPLNLDFITTQSVLPELQENILLNSLANFHKTLYGVENGTQSYFLDFQIRQCRVTFWFGFEVSSGLSDVVKLFLQRKHL